MNDEDQLSYLLKRAGRLQLIVVAAGDGFELGERMNGEWRRLKRGTFEEVLADIEGREKLAPKEWLED